MTLRNVFLANSIVSIFFSLVLLLMPTSMLELFGMSTNPTDKLLVQFFGAQVLAVGLVTLFGMNTKELRSQRTLTLSFFIADVITFIVALGGMLSGVMNVLGWVIAVVYLLLALGFGYFQFVG
jgi:hypothetical protein